MSSDRTPAHRLTIGLTGGIGSGKSAVAKLLVAHGAALVDTDAIAHALTAAGGAAMAALQREFGADIADANGALDRAKMRSLAFADASVKRRLEGILHPMIGNEARRQAEESTAAAIVFDVPLLTESRQWRARCDRIVVVDCSEQTQVARVTKRSGWSEAQVRRVIAGQAGRDERRAIADAVIHNDGIALAALAGEVAVLWACWVDPGARAPATR